MKPYHMGATAHKRGRRGNVKIWLTSGVIFANNQDEATGKALGECQDAFPIDDGFFNHVGVAQEMPERTIRFIVQLDTERALGVAQKAYDAL